MPGAACGLVESHQCLRWAVAPRRGCAVRCAARDLAGSAQGAHGSSAWLPLPCCSKHDTGWLFPLQQGEPAPVDLEKLVSTVAAQKLVLETLAGKVSSPTSHIPHRAITGPDCFLLAMAPASWDGLHPVTSQARTKVLAQGAEHHLPCRRTSDGEC